MRERSHNLGKSYQGKVKNWLLGHTIFGLNTKEFGDAYSRTAIATKIGGKGFDFSLSLFKDTESIKILYVECKYRNEQEGNVNYNFHEYLVDVYTAIINANNDEKTSSEFLFISNISPDKWRRFSNSKSTYIENILNENNLAPERMAVDLMVKCTDVLVLSERIIEV